MMLGVDEKQFAALIQALGSAVKSLRKSHDLTQEDMAYGSGLSVRHYQQLEAGGGNPTLKTIFSVASMFKLSASELLKKSEETL